MKRILAFSLIIFPLICFANPNPDELGICYTFDKDTLKYKGACVISTGNGSGISYLNIDYRGKEYNFDYVYGDDKNVYHRNNFYKREKFENIPEGEGITCYKNKPYDICFLK